MLFLSAASGVRNKRDWVAKVVFLIQILLISVAVTITNFDIYGWKFTIPIFMNPLSPC